MTIARQNLVHLFLGSLFYVLGFTKEFEGRDNFFNLEITNHRKRPLVEKADSPNAVEGVYTIITPAYHTTMHSCQ